MWENLVDQGKCRIRLEGGRNDVANNDSQITIKSAWNRIAQH